MEKIRDADMDRVAGELSDWQTVADNLDMDVKLVMILKLNTLKKKT